MNRVSIFLLATLLTLGFAFAPSALAQSTDKAIQPVLQVPIPGLNFEGSVIYGSTGDDATKEQENCGEGYVCVTTIGDYLNGVYRYLVAAGVLLTIVLIMVGGVEYMLGSATGGVARAVTRIRNATIGLILVLSAAVIVTFINPDIPSLNTLRIDTVKKAPPLKSPAGQAYYLWPIQVSEKLSDPTRTLDANGELIRHPHITARRIDVLTDHGVAEYLQDVANDLVQERPGAGLTIWQGWQDPQLTAMTFYENCVLKNCQAEPECNPFPPGNSIFEGDLQTGYSFSSAFSERVKGMKEAEVRRIIKEEAAALDQAVCPYNSGFALAVMCEGDDTSRIDVACQLELEALMQRNGFCRSEYNPWHYEQRGNQTSPDTQACNTVPGVYQLPPEECPAADSSNPNAITVCEVDYSTCVGLGGGGMGLPQVFNFVTGECRGEA